jgi:hypothetical protein
MAELNEAFGYFNTNNKNIQNTIDYFFTQRNMKENHEYLDKNMNRKNKQVTVVYNFLAISIPIYSLNEKIEYSFEIEIFGDSGYHYKGTIHSFRGTVPNVMIPLKGDKKIFVHIDLKENETNHDSICFIEVPKRYQSVDSNEKEDNIEVNL